MDSLKIPESRYARSLIEASRDPLFTISPDGKITDINSASAAITNVSREKLIGTDFFDYFTEPEKAREMYKHIFAEEFVADFPLTIHDSKFTEVLFNGSVYKDEFGKVLGVVVVARDSTDHNIFEEELIDAKERAELATKIAEEAQSKAEEATLVAEDAVRSKQQFLSNMSHEIRTPMNAIIGFTKVLLKTDLSEKQREYLNAIKISGEALTVLINDILDLAKVDAGKMVFEKIAFKMSTSISAMIHVFEMKIQEKNLRLVRKYDPMIPPVLVGDPVRLHQIVLNLISNAVKFTNEGQIGVSVQLLSEDEDSVMIEFAVTDTGIGIDKEKMDHIFENFQQASSETARLFGGTGLGLAIVKNLVETQGGTITVSSIPAEGSSFSFILPFKKTKDDAALEEDNVEVDPVIENIKVLVVEDMAINQLLMKTLLDDFGFEHDIVGNGKLAIEKMQNTSYDIVLMDLQMPEMNGFEATRYLRNQMKSRVPIIALTADVTTVDLQKCKAVGMNDFISKPVDERLLYKKIVDLFKKHLPGQEDENVIRADMETQNPSGSIKYFDLDYLSKRTKGNPELMMEMIKIYIDQTPSSVHQMKTSHAEKDWEMVYNSIHKIIPSFSIMGIDKKYEAMAVKIQEYSRTREHLDEIEELVIQVETVCSHSCIQLKDEYELLKKK